MQNNDLIGQSLQNINEINNEVQPNTCNISKNKYHGNRLINNQIQHTDQFSQISYCSRNYNDSFKNYLFIIVLILSLLENIHCITTTRMLTNSSNYHLKQINILKTTSDYKTVYSVDFNGIMKIWDFIDMNTLNFRQQIDIGGLISWAMHSALFVWSNGAKIFIGSTNNLVKIYTLNSSNSLYIQPPFSTPPFPVAINFIYSIWVNVAGDSIFLSTGFGCHRIGWNGTSWVINTPGYLTVLGTSQFNYMTYLNNQQKVIAFNRVAADIIILKYNGTNYTNHQTIPTGLTSQRNCYVSSNQLYISCYGMSTAGGLSQFNSYKLNVSTDIYYNVRTSNTLTGSITSQYAFMNDNQEYLIAQISTRKFYIYKFQNSTGSFSYSFLNDYYFNGQRPIRIVSQRHNSRFQLVSTYQGNIYLLTHSCQNTAFLSNCLVCYIYTTCNQCKLGFILSSGKCVCPSPMEQIGGICDNFISRGLTNCRNAQRLVNGTIICHFCSIQSHQVLYNNQCTCKIGYHDPNNTGLCTEICGDGIALKYGCDDSNTSPGDGCSAVCQVQQGFQCNITNGSTFCKSQSLLRYSQDVIVFKDENSNKATLKLTLLNSKYLLPFTVQHQHFLPQSNYLSLFIIKNESSVIQQIEVKPLTLQLVDSDYVLYIEFDFNFTIQNLNARIELNYQNTRYYNYTQKIDFVMEGANMALKYSGNLSIYRNFAMINLLITILSVMILLFGFLTPKFIGLEMILTCQLIFFSQFLIQDASKWPIGFIFLKNLRFSTGYNDIIRFSQLLPLNSESIKFYNLEIKKHVIQNLNISFVLIFLSVIVGSVFLIRRFIDQRKILIQKQNYKIQQDSKQKQWILQRIQQSSKKIQKVYYLNEKSYSAASQLSFWLILPFFSALAGFLLIDEQYVKFQQGFINYNIFIKIGKLCIIVFFAIILLICLNNFINFWLPLKYWIQLEKRKQQIYYKRSLFIYLMILGYLIFFFNKINMFNMPISVFVLAVQVIFIFILVFINPYRQSLKVHTVTLFINHLVYVTFLGVINLINLKENIDQVVILGLGYFITSTCLFVLVLSIIRLYYEYRYGQKLDMQILKRLQEEQTKRKLQEKERLQKKKSIWQQQAMNKLSQIQKQRAKNKYLQENQRLLEQQTQMLKWLQKRNLDEQQKQKYYYEHYRQKPLQWLKDHDEAKYQQKMKQLNEYQTQKIKKHIKRQSQQEYNNLLTTLSTSYQKKMQRFIKKLQAHKKSLQKDSTYSMNVIKNNQHKHFQQSYELKDQQN